MIKMPKKRYIGQKCSADWFIYKNKKGLYQLKE